MLIAINQPSRDALLRGALATEMMGCDAARVAEISGDEAELMGYLQRFADYRDLWLRQGVGVMYRKFLTDEKVSARMLRRDDGERRLTNLLHLGEQIHQAAATHESPDALLRWLATKRRDGAADEVAQLRLESDRNLVQIVTIHKAKGLEFPIVFCPFLWDGNTRFGGPKPEGREYHDDDGTAVVDFRPDDEIGDEKDAIDDAIKLEESAESLRLIYVALTRAVYRCYVIAGTYTTNSFGRPHDGGEHEEPPQLARRRRQRIAAELVRREALAGRHRRRVASPGRAAGAPPRPRPAARRARHAGRAGPDPRRNRSPPCPRRRRSRPRGGSAASAASPATRRARAAANDHDARIADVAKRIGAPPPDIAPDDILRFPRGTSAGECLHAIFERIDFTAPAGWNDAIARGLSAHPQFLPGVRAAEQSPLLASMAARMLTDVTRTTLPDGIVLGSIPTTRRLTELEFSLPAPRVSAHALNAALRSLGYDVPRLAFRDLEGYLKGFIDLVFEHGGRYYVLDWKSNHLGYAPSDYGPAALQAAMAEHSYHLQYLLYALAVDRYLRHRVPGYRHDTHFGGVLYLFVRGVRPDWVNADGTPAGVFHHRPTAATLARLDALFAQEPAKVARMSAAFIQTPDQALAEGFAHHVVRWARESDAPDHTLDALRAAARATSLATASGHVCTYLADIVAAAEDLDEPALRQRAARIRNGRHAGGARCAPADPRRRRPPLPAPLLRLRAPAGAAADGSLRPTRRAPSARTRRRCSTACSPPTRSGSANRPDWQKIATALALERRLTIISGGPGTGKTTTVVNVLACVLAGNPDCRIRLAAPTGKAAARMLEAIRNAAAHLPADLRERLPAESFTVHRLLGVLPDSGEFRHHAGNPLPIDLLVVDEASMLDLALATKLVEAVPPAAHIILLGDKDQLAAVESGAVFSELSADPTLSNACVERLSAVTGIPAARIACAAPIKPTRLARQRRLAHRELPLREGFRHRPPRRARQRRRGQGRDRLPALGQPIRRSSGSRTRIRPRRPHRSSGSSTG